MKPCCLAHCPESVSLSIHHHCDPCDSLVCIWQCFLSKILKNLRIILHLIYKNRSFGWPKHFTPTLYSKSGFACTTNIQDLPHIGSGLSRPQWWKLVCSITHPIASLEICSDTFYAILTNLMLMMITFRMKWDENDRRNSGSTLRQKV